MTWILWVFGSGGINKDKDIAEGREKENGKEGFWGSADDEEVFVVVLGWVLQKGTHE